MIVPIVGGSADASTCGVALGVADDDSAGVVVLLGGVSTAAADSHGFVVNPN